MEKNTAFTITKGSSRYVINKSSGSKIQIRHFNEINPQQFKESGTIYVSRSTLDSFIDMILTRR